MIRRIIKMVGEVPISMEDERVEEIKQRFDRIVENGERRERPEPIEEDA